MADSLSVTLSVDRTLVQSQTQVMVTATITDTSTTARVWTLAAPLSAHHALLGFPPDSCQVGRWGGASNTVPAGGSLILTAPIVFFFQDAHLAATSQQTNPQAIYFVGALFETTDGQVWSPVAGQLPQVTVLPVIVPGTDAYAKDTDGVTSINSTPMFPLRGTLDFRDNQLSAFIPVGTF